MATSFTVISLGKTALIDPIEWNTTAENAGALVGTTFGDASAPLWNATATFAPAAPSYASGGLTGVYDQNSLLWDEYFSIDGGARQAFDAVAVYNATITYIDGTTASVTAVIVQDTSGNTYWVPETTDNADMAAMEAKAILSLTLDSVSSAESAGLAADRAPWAPLCYCAGTRIDTDTGERLVETLRPGDLVMTRDHGLQPLRWVGRSDLDAEALSRRAELRPICIRSGALGGGLPKGDLLLSPQHRVLVRSRIAARMFGAPEVLAPAKALLALPGIEISEAAGGVSYFHLLFDRHEIVLSNAAETESLFTGPEALRNLDAAARAELLALFPLLRLGAVALPRAARPLLRPREARRLAQRHARNRRPLAGAPGAA